MKRRLSFLAAVIAVTSTGTALAQVQDPGKMFLINAVTPGVVSFSGEGTAQFNNSSSTANAFSVGSSTNFGVNAAASSTNDYMVDSNALLQLSGTSQLQQTIGTSSSAANTMAAAEAASTAATTIATKNTQSEFGQTWSDYVAKEGGTQSGTSATFTGADASEKYKTQAAYEAAKKDFYNEQVNTAYSNVATSATQSSSQGASGQGIIRGEFITTNSNKTDIGATAGSSSANTASAVSTANEAFGSSFEEYSNKFASFAGSDGKISTSTEVAAAKAAGVVWDESTNNSGNKLSNTDWSSKRQEKIDSLYAALQLASASQGSVNTDSQATVTVTGVGSIATLNSSDQSAFNVDVATRLRNSIPETNGTANGSAGGNLATSSFANQSNTLSASAFIQAFGPDTVTLTKGTDGKITAEVSAKADFTFKDSAALTVAPAQ